MRYEKQVLFNKIREEGQNKLKEAKVAVVGLGALGSAVSEQLARAGIGNLIIVDQDIVELSNLQRQTLYTEGDINKSKAEVAKQRLEKINSEIKIKAHPINLNFENIDLIKSDLILDCTDNLETRFLINDFALKNRIPWVYGAVAGSQGSTFNIIPEKVCFECIFENATPSATCSEDGIISPIVQTIASIQVVEALKIALSENRDEIEQKLVFFDIWSNNINKINVNKRENCEACKGNYKHLNPEEREELFKIELCKTKAAYAAKPKKHLKMNFEKIKDKFNIKTDAKILLISEIEGEDIIIHNFGEITFKGCKDKEKMEKIAKQIYGVAL